MRCHSIRSAERGDIARHGERLDAFGAQALDGKRLVALGQRLSVGADEQAVMAESGRRGVERLEELDLRRGIGDVVLAPDHMGDAEIDVVGDARQRVEVGPVGPDQNRVRQRGGVDMLPAAHQVVPDDVALLEQKAPMRLAPFRLKPRPLFGGQFQGGAVVDRRLPAGELALALQLELLGRFVGRDRGAPSASNARPPWHKDRSDPTGAPQAPSQARARRDPRECPRRTPPSTAPGRCRRGGE